MTRSTKNRVDVYTRVTSHIVAQLEQGVRPWFKPWNAENAAGRITRPLRHNGLPYNGINILMLWAASELQGFSCPFWLTFQQAKQFGGHVKKGEHGSPVTQQDSAADAKRYYASADYYSEGQEIVGSWGGRAHSGWAWTVWWTASPSTGCAITCIRKPAKS